MHVGSVSSQQDALEQLTEAVDGAFGARDDELRASSLAGTAQAIWILSQQSLGAYEAEPDFIAEAAGGESA